MESGVLALGACSRGLVVVSSLQSSSRCLKAVQPSQPRQKHVLLKLLPPTGTNAGAHSSHILLTSAASSLSTQACKCLRSRERRFICRASANSKTEPGSDANELRSGGEGIVNAAPDSSASSREVKAVHELLEAAEEVTRGARGSDEPAEQAPCSSSEPGADDEPVVDTQFLRKVASLKEAEEALRLLTARGQARGKPSCVVSAEESSAILLASLGAGNVGLAFSILEAMRGSLLQRRVDSLEPLGGQAGWRWAPPTLATYATLVRGLATSLRVSEALRVVTEVSRRGVPIGEEVPFGKVVDCPTCQSPIAVVQPQFGVQLVPCANCRYQYELMSGSVVSCESEAVGTESSLLQRGLRFLRLVRKPAPQAVHAMVVSAPDGSARTHRFATPTADVPAQEGERVTVASAAPESAARGLGPVKSSTRTPGWSASEPMSLTNHATNRIASLLRPPPKPGSGAATDNNFLIPTAILLAGGDAASSLINPALPQILLASTLAVAAAGTLTNTVLLPRLNQLPTRTAEAAAARQQLLLQHRKLQERLQSLVTAAGEEVRMLARMSQLENKMEAVGEPAAYSMRLERVRRAREGLDQRLAGRLGLMDEYAKILSMIEIEVEMGADILVAESVGETANLVDQIERLMEVEALQEEWQLQAEANEELERLMRSAPPLPDTA